MAWLDFFTQITITLCILQAPSTIKTFKLHLVFTGFNIHWHTVLEGARVLVLRIYNGIFLRSLHAKLRMFSARAPRVFLRLFCAFSCVSLCSVFSSTSPASPFSRLFLSFRTSPPCWRGALALTSSSPSCRRSKTFQRSWRCCSCICVCGVVIRVARCF